MHSSYSLLLLLASAFNLHLSNGLDFKHHNNTELAAVLQQVGVFVPLSWQLVERVGTCLTCATLAPTAGVTRFVFL